MIQQGKLKTIRELAEIYSVSNSTMSTLVCAASFSKFYRGKVPKIFKGRKISAACYEWNKSFHILMQPYVNRVHSKTYPRMSERKYY